MPGTQASGAVQDTVSLGSARRRFQHTAAQTPRNRMAGFNVRPPEEHRVRLDAEARRKGVAPADVACLANAGFFA